MDAAQPIAWPDDGATSLAGGVEIEPAFQIFQPCAAAAGGRSLVFASPHSGRIYPERLMAASHLDADAIRRSEDAFVDELIAGAPGHGVAVIVARLARAWLDVNREPWELDPSMFSDALPAFANGRSARVAAGLGSIARIVTEGQEIYRRKLTFAEAKSRVEAVHGPYHAALGALVADIRAANGVAVLIDWHSMPSAAAAQASGGMGADVVLGDRFGSAASPQVMRRVERELRAMGWRVARNAPYAGGFTTEHYGRPGQGVHALQIELNRGLYLDEASLRPTPAFAGLKADLDRLIAGLAAVDWLDP